jgi:hypothetical protein
MNEKPFVVVKRWKDAVSTIQQIATFDTKQQAIAYIQERGKSTWYVWEIHNSGAPDGFIYYRHLG